VPIKDSGRIDRWVGLVLFPSLEEAQIVRSRLETEGVAVLIPQEDMASPPRAGVSILVRQSQLKYAKEIIDQISRGDFALDDAADPPELREHTLMAPPIDSSRLEDADAIELRSAESRKPQFRILVVAHLVMGVLAAFVLLSQQRWSVLAISRQRDGLNTAAIVLAAIWPFAISWIRSQSSGASRARTWIFVGFLVAGSVIADTAVIQWFNTFAWPGFLGITVIQAVTYSILASRILVPKSKR
jgi:hypothetical protein